jgi:hypothetical protein
MEQNHNGWRGFRNHNSFRWRFKQQNTCQAEPYSRRTLSSARRVLGSHLQNRPRVGDALCERVIRLFATQNNEETRSALTCEWANGAFVKWSSSVGFDSAVKIFVSFMSKSIWSIKNLEAQLSLRINQYLGNFKGECPTWSAGDIGCPTGY